MRKKRFLCGVFIQKFSLGSNEFTYNELDPLEGNRILFYEDLTTPIDICTDEHINVTFTVDLEDISINPTGLIPGTKVYGRIYWHQFGDELELKPYPGTRKYTGVIEGIGLKQAFGTNPGWIGVQFKFVFPTQGSLSKDTTMIGAATTAMRTHIRYYQHL